MICTVHTHSTLCDGKDTPAAMAAAAFAAGAAGFGLSGHSHTPIPHDAGCTLPADLTAYRAEGERLRRAYAGRMEVLIGIEQDSCTEEPVPDWADFWIGSVHNLYDPAQGRYDAVDWDAEKLSACRDRRFGGDMLALVEAYYADVAAMAVRRPTILGHLDLIAKFNAGNVLFDESSPRYRAAALAALHAVDPAATLLEINTGAMARGYREAPYPAPFLLREWRCMGGQIILTADAHSAGGIVFGYTQAARAALAAGFREQVILTAAGWRPTPLTEC